MALTTGFNSVFSGPAITSLFYFTCTVLFLLQQAASLSGKTKKTLYTTCSALNSRHCQKRADKEDLETIKRGMLFDLQSSHPL